MYTNSNLGYAMFINGNVILNRYDTLINLFNLFDLTGENFDNYFCL